MTQALGHLIKHHHLMIILKYHLATLKRLEHLKGKICYQVLVKFHIRIVSQHKFLQSPCVEIMLVLGHQFAALII